MASAAVFTVNKTLEFTGNMIRFDTSQSTGAIIAYIWDYDDGATYAESTFSADYAYANFGNRNPFLKVYDTSSITSDPYYLSATLTINPRPSVALSGAPIINNPINIWDANGAYYASDTINMLRFDFGDGSSAVSGTTSSVMSHAYASGGNFDIAISAYDVSGNTAIGNRTISILAGNTCIEKDDYISLCGPASHRIGPCKDINLTRFLPEYLQQTDVITLVQFYEDFLNEMYSGLCGFQMVESSTSAVSATNLSFTQPPQNLNADPRISILEKIKRLSDLHDPDLIDEQYLQFFAKYLGYNVSISRNEIGGFGTFGVDSTVCSASDSEKYLRFTISELPHWYKIKTTRDMIRVMLYSFGLIGDIIQFYTKDYDSNFQNWKPDDNDDLAAIPDTWYPTPHFSVKIDIDKSISLDPNNQQILTLLMKQGDRILRAIESVRPINTVLHNLTGITTEYIDLYAGAQTRFSRYIRIENEGDADWWKP